MLKLIMALVVLAGGYWFIASKRSSLDENPVNIQKPHDEHGHSDQGNFAPPKTLPGIEGGFSLKRFASVFPGTWEQKDGVGDQLVLQGGKIPVKFDMDGSVLEVARKLVAQFGVDPKQVSPQVDRPKEKADKLIIKLYQHYQGMLVYESDMLMMVRKNNSIVTGIRSDFKRINSLDLTQAVRRAQVSEKYIAEGHSVYGGETIIYVEGGHGMAAYRIRYDDPVDGTTEILVSAKTGKVLLEKRL